MIINGLCIVYERKRRDRPSLTSHLPQAEPGEEVLVGDDFEEHQRGEADHGETTVDFFGVEVEPETGEGFVGGFGILRRSFGGIGFGGHGKIERMSFLVYGVEAIAVMPVRVNGSRQPADNHESSPQSFPGGRCPAQHGDKWCDILRRCIFG